MLRLTVFLLALSSAFAQAQAQKKPITLEALSQAGGRGGRGMGAGMPAAWTPDGKLALLRENRRLAFYDPATKTNRELLSTEGIESAAVSAPREDGPVDWTNRRARAGGPQFSDSGKELLYPSGGDIFLIHVDTGKWDQLTKTPAPELDPKLSPDGRMVAFRRGWDLYTVDAASGKETRLTQNGTETLRNGAPDWVYPEELELGTGFWWSPDSKSIAYLQFDTNREPVFPHADVLRVRALYEPERYPQAGENNPDVRLGVLAATGGPTKWLDLGDTRDSYLVGRAGWMPDSRSVYIVRLNRVQNRLDVISMNVESGEQAALVRESDPYWINLSGDVQFLKDGKRFLWTSERDGFRHIYLYTNDGKTVRQLTRGAWEVTAISAVDEAGGRVFYMSSEPTHLERHLYSIRLDGSDKRRLTKEAGTHSISISPTGAYYFDTYSSLQSPSRTVLHAGDGAELGVFREADRTQMEQYEILPTEIVFDAPADVQLYARLIKPTGFQPGKKYPVVMNVYGGPGVGLPIHNSWAGVNMDQVYAQHGYVVWESENRGGQGRGHAFETPIYHQMGVQELADQVAGVKYLISLGFVDPERIGIHGWSYGGFMTANALLNAPDVFRCGISGAPVTSWMNYDTIYTERYMGLPKDNRDAYEKTALPPKAANLKGRLMLVHNIEDDNVLFQNSLQLTSALQQAGKIFDYMLYPQKSHGVTGPASRQMNAAMLEFFDRWLKP
ncbi:MAG: S9 family peptidase [Acidobacteriia bacterium]|nr:S9 family peptidase [Terriglobia bacterium]